TTQPYKADQPTPTPPATKQYATSAVENQNAKGNNDDPRPRESPSPLHPSPIWRGMHPDHPPHELHNWFSHEVFVARWTEIRPERRHPSQRNRRPRKSRLLYHR